jgi:hypothetical protein
MEDTGNATQSFSSFLEMEVLVAVAMPFVPGLVVGGR